ncbi:MAG: presqualene diphosphate synthase HpnD, partial [Methylophilaceae bacterium]
MNPQQYCQEKAAASGSSFYYSFLFLPTAKRQAITALYAFCREVDDIADECQDIQTAYTKLNWWRDEITRLYAGQPQHPVSHALSPAIKQYQLAQELFMEIIDGMQMDLEQDRYQNFSQLQLYCYRVASVVGLLSAEIFGYQNRKTLKYAHDLGLAFQLTNIIRDVGEDARRGRIYLPLDEMAQFGVSETDILHGHQSEKIQALMEYQISRAQQLYD